MPPSSSKAPQPASAYAPPGHLGISSNGGYLGGRGGVVVSAEPVSMAGPQNEVYAHANWELAQMKLTAAQSVADAQLELAQAKMAVVHAHVAYTPGGSRGRTYAVGASPDLSA